MTTTALASHLAAASQVLGQLPAGLNILTYGTQSTEPRGMLASWVQQASFSPLMVSVVLNPQRAAYEHLHASPTFVLNLLPEQANALMKPFANPNQTDPFAGLATTWVEGYGVQLSEALGALYCKAVSFHPSGDHVLLLAEVEGGSLLAPEATTWVHKRKQAIHY
jgi:flavin reductase (DIM6/NTAB) family NADH-FMN oxidoreductase RutF